MCLQFGDIRYESLEFSRGEKTNTHETKSNK